MSKNPKNSINGSSGADVVVITCSRDGQTSADASTGSEFSGAITKALRDSLARLPDASFHKILQLMQAYLKAGRYSQLPQMSSERPLKLDATFRLGPSAAKPATVHMLAGATPRRKALSIAINYEGQPCKLRGCINDQDTITSLWKSHFGVPETSIRTLRDDDRKSMPTKANMLEAMRWLVGDVRFGDQLYFHYSGHGSQTCDRSGDERDGKDETLVPCDYTESGMITDDDLRKLLVLSLPDGVSLFGLLDCCHSGTGMDLPFVVKMADDGRSVTVSRKPAKCISGLCNADVVMLSGCKDSQTSADAQIGTEYAGAMTKALQNCIKQRPTLSFHHLLQSMRSYLKRGKYTQVPQMSSERMLDLSESVVPPR